MFSNLGFGEVIMMAVLGLVIFGPERLPKAASDAVRTVRRLRAMADSAMTEIKAELPPDLADLDLRSMNPRNLLQKAIFDDGSPASAELDEHYREREARRRLDDAELSDGQTSLLDEQLLPVEDAPTAEAGPGPATGAQLTGSAVPPVSVSSS